MVPYLVCEFSQETLSNLVKECFGSDFPDVLKKPQVDFIFHYLHDLDAKSILLEPNYQDKDYLEDFSRYYVKCFQNGGHRCARLHFFNSPVAHKTLDRVLREGKESTGYTDLKGSYLGFIVVKPLPKTFIGKTCLKIYPKLSASSPDVKLLSREYKVNLFGIDLTVNTIAFQEQDKVVSACATTAIWTGLQACKWKDDREIPACSEITTNAINHIDHSSNSFPNDGLTHKQILRALDCEGLKHHMEKFSRTRHQLFDIVRCHIDSGIPIILGADIHNSSGDLLGGHAVTILGYKKKGDDLFFYLHDDRFGPFAKGALRWLPGHRCEITLHRKDAEGKWLPAHESLRPNCLIIPTHKKVRISFRFPMNTGRHIVEMFETCLKDVEEARREFSGALTYSLRLAQISAVKDEILKMACPEGPDGDRFMHDRAHFLTQSCARFQWVVAFSLKGLPVFRVLFDATDIPQGNAVTTIFVENQAQSAPVLELFKLCIDPRIDGRNTSFIDLVFKHFKDPVFDYRRHLDQTYGGLRAPRYIRRGEISDGDIYRNESMWVFYDSQHEESLDDILGQRREGLIWAIAADGALLIGVESEGKGHPTLTRFKPARIAGELKRESSRWTINAKSGRYSGDYSDSPRLLENALRRFKTTFPLSKRMLHIAPPPTVS